MTVSWSKEPCGRQKGLSCRDVVVEQSAVAVGRDLEARQTWTDSQLCHSLASGLGNSPVLPEAQFPRL